MCGIVGVLRLTGAGFEIGRIYLERMRDTMAHRGPDGAGIWVSPDRRIGLGHRRLAIIDLSPQASQPMHDVSGKLTIVFNGEIYNHAQLRTELEALGHYHWQTDHSDTEVILEAFRHWGIECIHRFRGMFAFALWDQRSRELWLVRDRIGIKPLYYGVHHGRLVFASEIKSLLADPDQPKEVDEEALYHYLTFLISPAPSTMFRGIRKVPAGCWIRAKEDGSMEVRRYWDVWDHTTPLTGVSETETADMLLKELETSVELRKVSDVPVGIFLSGGIDSSTNALLFSDGERKPVNTFSIGYHGDYRSYPSELGHARKVAELVRAEHHELLLSLEDLVAFLPRMVFHQDEPIADPVCVPLYFVSKLARDNGVIVCQVGEGSDELFIGYPGWKRQLAAQQWADVLFPSVARSVTRGLLHLWPWQQGSRFEFLRRSASGLPIFWSGAGAFTEPEKANLMESSVRSRLGGLSSYEIVRKIRARFLEAAWEPSHVNWMTYMDLNHRLPELLLMRVDKMSMATSLEARVPFLDHRFVALALSVPSKVRFRNGVSKYILKRAVQRIVPEEIIQRPKQGFGVPLAEWLIEGLADQIRSAVQQFCRESGLLDEREAERILDRGETARIWCLWNLGAWWLHHFRCASNPSAQVSGS